MSVQPPFRDVVDDAWSDSEIEMLMRGVAAGQSWEIISADISSELRDRTAKACEMAFERLRIVVQ